MPAVDRFIHEFVEYLPGALDEGVLYISLPFTTVVHLCACGCGTQVVSALDPDDYAITFDGETISLWPSIGNWDFYCRSHYIIRSGKVKWVPTMSDKAIAAGRHHDRLIKRAHGVDLGPFAPHAEPDEPRSTLRTKARALLRRVTQRG